MGDIDRMAVLVTGGAGYVGSHAVLALRDAGRPVVVIDDLSTGFRWSVSPETPFVQADVADERAVRRLIAEHRVGAIMHFAGSSIVPESVQNPLKYYLNNTAKSRTLVAAAVAEGVKHFVFSSTAAIYGVADSAPVAEDAPTSPINPYGRSKLMTEVVLKDVAAVHDFNYCALRYFNVAGADPAGRCGQSTVSATHLIKIAVEAACGTRDGVEVTGYDFPTADGTGVRDYIHVTDLAAAHINALDALIAAPNASHTFNCGYGRGFSVLEVLDSVDRVAGISLTRRMGPRRAGDPPTLIADNRRILSQLSWRPRYEELDTIVSHALAWERRLGNRSPTSTHGAA